MTSRITSRMTSVSARTERSLHRSTGRPWRLLVAAGVTLVLGACASLPPMPARSTSHAEPDPLASTLGRRVAAEAPAGRLRWSGLRLVPRGEEALATLIALADAAERTLDLQYYAVLDETSSRVLFDRLQRAAARGVRVRLLIDDFNTAGTDDALLRLARQPGVEVRLYNPLPAGRFSVFTKVLTSLDEVPRINNRMHNKQFVADNALALSGGRNLGDAYFLQAADANFLDIDLLVGGPAVRELSATFDRYWNSELAYPAEALIRGSASQSARPAGGALDAPATLPAGAQQRIEAAAAALQKGPLALTWAPARLLSDAPEKTLAEGAPSDDEIMFDDFTALLASAKHEVQLVTPYFVPGPAGMALIGQLCRRGVRVRILTASLAGTDAPAVHLGYSRYREALVDMGVELHELRAVPGGPEPRRLGGVHSRTNLHAKAALIDGTTLVVGSMNFDPRSEKLNTEMALVARSPALGDEIARLFDRFMRQRSYRLARDAASGALEWRSFDGTGQATATHREPDVSLLKLLSLKLLMPLAPESML